MNPGPRRRASRACARCQKRKTKCDFRLPKCTPCLKSGTNCQGFDAHAGNDVPRSLVKSLEEEASRLEVQLKHISRCAYHQCNLCNLPAKIAEATVKFGMPIPGTFFANNGLSNFVRPSVPPLIILRTLHLDPESKYCQLSQQRVTQEERFQSYLQSPRPPIGFHNIPSRAVDDMVQHYRSTLLGFFPVLQEAWLAEIFQRVSQTHSELRISHFESFVAYLILAISSVSLYWKASPQARAASLSLFSSALQHLEQIVEIQELERLQAVLLLAHYADLNPEVLDIWTCSASAGRIVLNLGLHADLGEQTKALHQRLFWVAYNLDRSLSAMLKIPLSFPEESISLKPDHRCLAEGPLNQSDDMTLFRSIEIEVHQVLHLKQDTPRLRQSFRATATPDITKWISDIGSCIEEWYITKKKNEFPKEVVLFRCVIYNYLKVKIYRPTPRLPLRTTTERQICFDVCQNVIESAKDMLSFNPTAVIHPWQISHILFDTAVILLDACWQYRSQPLMRPAASHVVSVIIPECFEMMEGVGKWWSKANICLKCLRPMLEEVARPYSGLFPEPSDLIASSDAATTENLKGLMFADRIPYDLSLEDVLPDPEWQIFDDSIYNLDLQDQQWAFLMV